MPDLRVSGLTKRFGATPVLDDVSFSVGKGQFVTLLGPSGCGKTTTLLSIAGLETPEGGSISCGQVRFFDAAAKIQLPAESRNVGIVFQTYAIWPHMTVADNVGFPLRIRRRSRAEIRSRVEEVLDLVELGGYGGRYPYQLSGGQQQRVALARALAHPPDLLLLDEPFSNLDAKLRERARVWFRALQRTLNLTTVFVTHDQDEALSMSDRILVMDAGRIAQQGTPEEVYRLPATAFVADFVGQCNLVEAVVRRVGDGTLVAGGAGVEFSVALDPSRFAVGARVTLAIRPEDVHLESPAGRNGEVNRFPARLASTSFFGDHFRSEVLVGDLRLAVLSRSRPAGAPIAVEIDPGTISVLGPPVSRSGG
ncbi:MAG TPA: ABC transporter ATP-binding protein [Candidatus Dormibacteraeota bacterium]